MLVGTDYSSTGSLASSAVRSTSGTVSSLLGNGTAASGVSALQQDTYTPGGSVNSASAYQRSGRAWTRPTLSDDQLQTMRSMERRRAQERHALAVKKSAMYTPGPAVPLPVTAPGSVPVPVAPVVAAVAAGAAAADALDKKDEKTAEAPKEEAKVPEQAPQQQAAQETGDDGNILTDAAGAVWDGTKAVWEEETDPAHLRRLSKKRIAALDDSKFAIAPRQILSQLEEWEPWKKAADVALFAALPGEVPTESLLKALWQRGSQVWLPWIGPEGIMEMAAVAGPEDLVTGRFGIREPRPELHIPTDVPPEILVITPGLVFDRHGGRIGKGKGFYDRWLARHPKAIAAGLCFDVQVYPNQLLRKPHDWPMAHLVTEHRLESFLP